VKLKEETERRLRDKAKRRGRILLQNIELGAQGVLKKKLRPDRTWGKGGNNFRMAENGRSGHRQESERREKMRYEYTSMETT